MNKKIKKKKREREREREKKIERLKIQRWK
jgi:hypothetical protein